MNSRLYRRFAVLIVTAHVSAAALVADDAKALPDAFTDERPNIIFFLTDDQRADFLGCTGHPVVKTPVIDSLAKRGVRFDNAFVTTSICAASRATLLTGLYERTHRFTFGTPPVSSLHTQASYPRVLRNSGYKTGFIGKFGIAVRKGEKEAMFDFFRPIGRNPYHKKQPDGSTRHETELAGDEAVKFLKSCDKGTPFCLSVSFNASHAEDGDKKDHFPYPKAVASLYEGIEMPAPHLDDPAVFESQPPFLKQSMNRDRYFWRWDTPEKYQHNMRNYLRMISGIDRVIGRVLEEVEKTGRAKNTVVIYMADNGYYAASRGFAGKWSHYEQSQRVPLIIFDPRAEKDATGKVIREVALNVDIAPTILGLAGENTPDHYQGASLVPFVNHEALADWRSDFFCEHLMNNKSIPKWEGVRGERFKYARYFEQDPPYEFLHDLKTDPDELKNLAGESEHAATLAKMRARTDALKKSYVESAKQASAKIAKRAEYATFDNDHGASDPTDLLTEALALDPDNDEARFARAVAYEEAGNFGKGAEDLDYLVGRHADNPQLLQRTGVMKFYHGDMAGSIAAFDKVIELQPGEEPGHWQRGLAYYYAKEFEKGRKQFEVHQTVNSNDVENAVWHFLCVAQLEGIEKARENLIPITGDARVPMMQVQQLFAGMATPEDVLKAANAGDPSPEELKNNLCYAHLYLGLYWEAMGDAEKSAEHIQKSAVDHAMKHYMGETARVHQRVRNPKAQTPTKGKGKKRPK